MRLIRYTMVQVEAVWLNLPAAWPLDAMEIQITGKDHRKLFIAFYLHEEVATISEFLSSLLFFA